MQGNQLLNDIILLVRGSNLPTKQEIEQMTYDEKVKLENEQYQIIQIFRQQALLDIWQLKNRIAQLLTETVLLREMDVQAQEFSDDNKTNLIRQKKNQKKQEVKKLNKNKKESQIDHNRINQKQQVHTDIQQNKNETDLAPKNKPTLRINSKIQEDISNDNTNTKYKPEIKYLQPNRRSKVRNLVKKNPRLDTFNLRIKEKERNRDSKNNPKYPFTYQQTDTTPKKYASLVSTLNPKYLINAENQNQKDKTEKNPNKKDDKILSPTKKTNKNTGAKNKNAPSKNDANATQSKETKTKQTQKDTKFSKNQNKK